MQNSEIHSLNSCIHEAGILCK